MKDYFRRFFYSGSLLPLAIFALWWRGAATGWWNTFLLPSPAMVWDAFLIAVEDGTLAENLFASLGRIAVGFSLSALLALALAFLCCYSTQVRRQLEPTLEFLRHIPPMAAIPLLILWFGIGAGPKIILIILATFFPVFLNALHGIGGCDERLVEVAKVFGYTKAEAFRYVALPAAVPSILTGLQLGIGYSWRALVAAELVAASSGLGYMILDAEQLSRSDVVLMGVFIIGIFGAAMDYVFVLISRALRKSGRLP